MIISSRSSHINWEDSTPKPPDFGSRAMSIGNLRQTLVASVLALAVSACGAGGGGGANVASIPPAPVVAPLPATPVVEGALALPPSGITQTTDFATIGGDFKLRWNAAIQAYEVDVPQIGSGRIVQTFYGPYGGTGNVIAADGSKLLDAFAFNSYSYTGTMRLSSAPTYGATVAFGVPTPAGAVPVTGTADFKARLEGVAGGWILGGSALLQFDFGAGKLSGYMDPVLNGPMGTPDLPRYTFNQTVYSTGSTTFSGAFDVAGPTPSSFSGQFTGPNAQELMGSFQAPFLDWDNQGNPTVWKVLNGVMVGKRP